MLAEGIQSVHVLLSDEALLLTAVKEFDDVTPQGSTGFLHIAANFA